MGARWERGVPTTYGSGIRVPRRTHHDPVVAGFDVNDALIGLDDLAAHLAEINPLIEAETESMYREAVARAPRSKGRFSGRYASAIRRKIFRDNLSDTGPGKTKGAVFVIQLPWLRHLEWQRAHNPNFSKLWPKNLPLWLEYSTFQTPARPHFMPAFAAATRRLNAAVERLLQRRAA